MKRHDDEKLDARLRELLTRELPDVPENPWFTRRVLNRLPARGAGFAIAVALHAVALVVLVGCWVWLIGDARATTVFTVRDVLEYGAVAAVTLLLWRNTSRDILPSLL